MADAAMSYKPPFDSPVRSLGIVVITLALIAVTGTFLILTGMTPVEPTRNVIVAALIVNAVLVGTLIIVLSNVVTLITAEAMCAYRPPGI